MMDTAVDPTSGTLYAVWQDNGVGSTPIQVRHQVVFSQSTDAGLTWSTPISIGDTPVSNGRRSQVLLPTVAVAGDRTVGVTYYDWRFDGAEPETLTDVWFVHCHSAWADCTDPWSWHPDARITESSFDLRQSPILGGGSYYFLGHYVGLAATEHDFLAFFTMPHDDGPSSVFFSRIAPNTALPANLVLQRVRLQADTATRPGRHNGWISVRGFVNANAPFGGLVDDVLATGLTVFVDGAGGVSDTLQWTGDQCFSVSTRIGPRVRCVARDTEGKLRRVVLRPVPSFPNVFQMRVRARGRRFTPSLAADPVTVIVSTTSFDRSDQIGESGNCELLGRAEARVTCREIGVSP